MFTKDTSDGVREAGPGSSILKLYGFFLSGQIYLFEDLCLLKTLNFFVKLFERWTESKQFYSHIQLSYFLNLRKIFKASHKAVDLFLHKLIRKVLKMYILIGCVFLEKQIFPAYLMT